MSASLHLLLSALLKIGAIAFILNEVRGLILAAPVLYGLYLSGGTPMAIYLAACSLGGIALSVIVPIIAVKKADRFLKARVAA
ncbi:hypothetical protein [Qipengyuania soli]|uniref:Uncharacterized protein n=1 Tax=Qipengyuania soli TaxID=2782568 RepID=A0A7S8F3E2_9SPHN|nr:hypothetical protein [Qipengyuania soli]QPC99725.1 hypothetical protein IRL76_03975 [Qipengyuania soli]